MSELDSTTGLVAVAAAALALLALLIAIWMAFRVRRLHAAQKAVLGGEARDVVGHTAELERRLAETNARIDHVVATTEDRIADAERRLDTVVSRSAVIRYDAYNEMTGRQSSSIALVDDNATGIVLSSILHREQARFYAKWVVGGESELELSPEEREAIAAAMAGNRGGSSQLEPSHHPRGG